MTTYEILTVILGFGTLIMAFGMLIIALINAKK